MVTFSIAAATLTVTSLNYDGTVGIGFTVTEGVAKSEVLVPEKNGVANITLYAGTDTTFTVAPLDGSDSSYDICAVSVGDDIAPIAAETGSFQGEAVNYTYILLVLYIL